MKRVETQMRYAQSYVAVCFPCRVAFTFVVPAVTKCWTSEKVRGSVIAQVFNLLPTDFFFKF